MTKTGKSAVRQEGNGSLILGQKRRIIERNVKRLALKNTDGFAMLGAAMKSAMNGNFDREMAARVFGFDPARREDLDELVLASVLNGLAEEDIEDIFRRFARRRGLDF